MLKSDMSLSGKYVNIREVTVDDAEFILSLRCNEAKAKYLHRTEYDIDAQKQYICNYLTKDNFIDFRTSVKRFFYNFNCFRLKRKTKMRGIFPSHNA